MFDIKENLKKLPDSPGVYLHKDKLGQVIYVGKAVSLKNRVRQYFQSSRNMDAKVRAMVANIEEFEYITTATEMEALILECNLIKKYEPKYNVLLRDDKTYPFIKITTNEEFPRVIKTRRVLKDGCKYFGPYSDVTSVNQIIDLLSNVFVLKKCNTRTFPKDVRPCLNYHIKKCMGICVNKVSKTEYMDNIRKIEEFLSGRQKPMIDYLTEKMSHASANMDFEMAAAYRDNIAAAKALNEKQRVVIPGAKDMDMILPVRGEKEHHIALFTVREGKLSGRETFHMQASQEDDMEDFVTSFMKQHYLQTQNVPKEILLNFEPSEKKLLENFLEEISGYRVIINIPQRGDKKALLDLAKQNTVEMTKTIDDKAKNQRERSFTLGSQIHDIIDEIKGEPSVPYTGRDYRIEAYDISNTNGVDTVGAMVVFEGLKASKKDYRRFKIRTVEGPNDYGSLQEVIYRRIKRAQAGDAGFAKLPELMLIDGGKNQVAVVVKILNAMNVYIPVAGLAKDNHHRTKALVYLKGGLQVKIEEINSEDYTEIELKDRTILFKYMGTIQEEVHRFAIEYHRGLRNQRMQNSVLDKIEGVGTTRRNSLLEHFGSVEKIKNASVYDLSQVKGMNNKVAEKIHEYFNC